MVANFAPDAGATRTKVLRHHNRPSPPGCSRAEGAPPPQLALCRLQKYPSCRQTSSTTSIVRTASGPPTHHPPTAPCQIDPPPPLSVSPPADAREQSRGPLQWRQSNLSAAPPARAQAHTWHGGAGACRIKRGAGRVGQDRSAAPVGGGQAWASAVMAVIPPARIIYSSPTCAPRKRPQSSSTQAARSRHLTLGPPVQGHRPPRSRPCSVAGARLSAFSGRPSWSTSPPKRLQRINDSIAAHAL